MADPNRHFTRFKDEHELQEPLRENPLGAVQETPQESSQEPYIRARKVSISSGDSSLHVFVDKHSGYIPGNLLKNTLHFPVLQV